MYEKQLLRDVQNRLFELKKLVLNKVDRGPLEVRFQLLGDYWQLHYGDPSYDKNHKGYWGASSIVFTDTKSEMRYVALDIIDQALVQKDGLGFGVSEG